MAEYGEANSALAEQGDVMSVVVKQRHGTVSYGNVKQRQGAVGGVMQWQSMSSKGIVQ